MEDLDDLILSSSSSNFSSRSGSLTSWHGNSTIFTATPTSEGYCCTLSPSPTTGPSVDKGFVCSKNEPVVESLLDLAVKVTAKHLSCEQIERHQPALDEAMLEKVAFWACPQDTDVVHASADVTLRGNNVWDFALEHIRDDHVRDMRQVGFMVTSAVHNCNVCFTFEKQQITSTSCESCTQRPWCSHVLAAIIYRIENAKSIPIHAPVIETLATLNRDQLLKLLHYAIYEDPGGVLGIVFRRIGRVRDPTSDINTLPGLPDPTFGLGHGAQSAWDLTLEEIRGSFRTKCYKTIDTFPCSLLDSAIKSSFVYERYIQRVVDLANIGQTEEAGQLLMTLVTEASNVLAGREKMVSKRYGIFIKTLEKICCLYIVQFTSESRSQLFQLCQNLNKNLKMASTCSKWAELPQLSLLFPSESTEVPGTLGGRQTSLFYEPLCAHIAPDPPEEFYNLLNGSEEPSYSTYDEPLALMLLRFEALRLWKKPGKEESELVRMGSVIIRKLLQMTQQFSIIKEPNRPKPPDTTNCENKKRKSVSEYADSGAPVSPVKRRKTSCVRRKAGGNKEPNKDGDKDDNKLKDDRHDISEGTDTETLTEIWTLMEDVEPDSDNDGIEERSNTSDYLSLMLDSIGKYQYDKESVSKEQLAYCLMHTCCSMYETPKFDSNLSETDMELLSFATLRALEFSRLRIATENRNSIKSEEMSAWHTLVQKMMAYYKENVEKMVSSDFSSVLERMYMKKLCQCNREGACFFGNAIPLELIFFLVKRTFDVFSPRNKHHARCLCLYTLCHSNKPLRYNTDNGENYDEHRDSDTYKHWMKTFSEMTVTFLQHMKVYPLRDAWLRKLFAQYETTQDGKALTFIWNELRKWSRGDHSDDIKVGILKLLLNLIKLRNSQGTTGGYSVSVPASQEMIEILCYKLQTKVIDLVLPRWKDVALFFRNNDVGNLIDAMLNVMTPDIPLSCNIVDSIFEYLKGNFEHTAGSCRVLEFFKQSDENLKGAFNAVMRNKDSYTPDALLYVAEVYTRNETLSKTTPPGKIFSKQVEEIIKIALKRLSQENKPQSFSPSRHSGHFLPNVFARREVEWVFKTFLEKPANMVVKCHQFDEIMSLAVDAFSNDLTTMMAICSNVKSEDLILNKCKILFGEHMIQIVKSRIFERLVVLRPKYYGDFNRQMRYVEEYFTAYTVDGRAAYDQLCVDIKQKHKTKRKLMSILGIY